MDNAFELSELLVDDLAEALPAAATRSGITDHNDRWEDLSPAGHDAVANLLGRYRDRYAALPEGDRWARQVRDTAIEYLDRQLSFHQADQHLRDLNSVASPFQHLRQVFDVMDTGSKKGWHDIVARLEGLPKALSSYRETLEEGRERGLAVAARQVEACIKEGRAHAGRGSSLGRLEGQFAVSGVGSTELGTRLSEAAEGARRAYGEMADYLANTYLPDADESDAVGADRHAWSVRRYLGIDLDPRETYEWGWLQVGELADEMQAVAAEIVPEASVSEVIEILETDPERSAGSPEEFIGLMQERQRQAVAALADVHFDIPEDARRVTVNLAPPGGSLGAYYVSPSEDFQRPGSVWYSVGNQQIFPLYEEVSTAYHEGFPGHHLQAAIVMSLGKRVSRLQKTFAWWSGSGEGWALYAERLMRELGFFEKPEYVLGMLASHIFRACRIVIDIGMHHGFRIPDDAPFSSGQEWSYPLAVRMLTDVAHLRRAEAESEVTRYLGWPAQAISYKVGERVILGLRDEMRRRQGTSFDLKDFHARVLAAGSPGLGLLKDYVLET